MSAKVIYVACSVPLWVDLASILARENNWTPCYWAGRAHLEQYVKQHFPDIIFHDHIDAIQGIFPKESTSHRLPALDEDLLKRLSFHEKIIMKMMDRIDPLAELNYEARLRLYYHHLRHWLHILDEFEPDIFFSPSSPHQIYDYVLYALCQMRGIKTILFYSAYDLRRLYVVKRFEEGSKDIQVKYEQKLKEMELAELSSETEGYLQETSGTYPGGIHFVLQPLFKREHEKYRRVMFLKNMLYTILLLFRSPTSFRETVGRRFIVWRLQSLYNALLHQDIDLSCPYIYVALHQQPENSTSPEGGLFVDQFLAILLLSKSLPTGWQIYVKEHPSQFIPQYGGNRSSRPKHFYSDVAALPYVKLIPVSFPSLTLIDHAKAVATVTGTIGWEAVVRGKPALTFGFPWYRGCEGVFYTPTQKSCQEALTQIADGYTVNNEKVRLFAQVIEEIGCSRYLYDKLHLELQSKASSIKEFQRLQYTSEFQDHKYHETIREMARIVQNFYDTNWNEEPSRGCA